MKPAWHDIAWYDDWAAMVIGMLMAWLVFPK